MSKTKAEDQKESKETEEQDMPLTIEMAEARLIDAMGDLIWILVVAIIADIILAIAGTDIGITKAISSIFGWVVLLIIGLSTIRLIRRELDKKNEE